MGNGHNDACISGGGVGSGGRRWKMSAVASAVDREGWDALIELITPVIPPMVRPPFFNMMPDFLVLDATRLAQRGAGGFDAVGFFDNGWDLGPNAAVYTRPTSCM